MTEKAIKKIGLGEKFEVQKLRLKNKPADDGRRPVKIRS
jgi:hypothetical protein